MKTLPRALPAEVGIDPRGIISFVEQAGKKGCHSIMVLRHNKVAAEGWWGPYRPEYNHVLYSLSKSFTSTAVGFAVQEGLLTTDDLVLSFFPDDLPDVPCENMQRMSVKHLLTMSTGHTQEPMIYASENWVRAFLASHVEHEPGSIFLYNTAATFMLSAIVQKLTGMTVFAYLKPRLFDPLEISGIWWEVNPQGINTGGFGLHAKTEDIAKFGAFLLNRGMWEGQQLLAAAWIDEATAKQIDNSGGGSADWQQGYGYQFWRSVEEGTYRGDGAYGQFCVVLPRQDAVVAITSGSAVMHEILGLVWSQLLPAMHDEVEYDRETQAALEQVLSHLQIALPQGEKDSEVAARYSDRCYSMDENVFGITRLSFHFGEKDTLTVWKGDRSSTIEIGYGQWNENVVSDERKKPATVHRPFFTNANTACAGAWNDNTYTLKVVYTHTVFSDTFRVTFDEAGIQVDYRRNLAPIGGGRTSYTLTGSL